MNRRQILKQLALGTTAAILLPSCLSDPKKVSIALNNLQVTGDDEELLAAIAETMIPETGSPGARSVEAHLFTLVMVDDCTDQDTKDRYLKGLKSFEDTCKKIGDKTFTKATPEERLQILKDIERGIDELDEEAQTFYKTSKRYIMQGYLSSSYFLTEVKPYELVPGPDFKGCVPVNETSKAI